MGRKAGLTDEKLLAVVGNELSPHDAPSPFTRDELLVIELADAMVETPSNVSDELYTRLRDKSPKNNSSNSAPNSPSKTTARG